MVEHNLQGLTEDEAALYDRQIRLWGYEAQWKLKSARILVIGLDGLGAEIVKNIVLSGVKSIVMWDDKKVTKLDLRNQFLVPQDSLDENRAEASKLRAQALNPLVLITCDSQPLADKNDDYFKDFELVISCNQTPSVNLKLDEACRKNITPFHATGVYGTFGYAFYDLMEHKYAKEVNISTWNGDVKKVVMNSLSYPSLQEVLNFNVKTPEMFKTLQKLPASILIFKALLKFEEEHGRKPTEVNDDYRALLRIRGSLLDGAVLPPESFPEVLMRSVSTEMPSPICAIVGAVVSQEAVKAVTQKGEPQRNIFFFDPVKLVGHVQFIGNES